LAHVNTTFFPKTNYIKDFDTRLSARIQKERVYFPSVDNFEGASDGFSVLYSNTPGLPGSKIMDLGSVTTSATATYDCKTRLSSDSFDLGTVI
jgi:hypothetical protein